MGTGVGSIAKLKPIVSDGKITNVQIIEQGAGYDPAKTFIKVTPSGRECCIFSRNL